MIGSLGREEMNDFQAFTDEQLIEQIECSEDAVTELILRYKKTVEVKAAKYTCEYVEKDDLVQEGMLGLLSAISHYNKEKNASFKTFADRCVENRMKNAVKKASPVVADSSLDEDSAYESSENPEDILIHKEQAKILSEKIKTNLSSLETQILKMFLAGYTYEQIADRNSITLKAVDNALQRARRKLKSIFR